MVLGIDPNTNFVYSLRYLYRMVQISSAFYDYSKMFL